MYGFVHDSKVCFNEDILVSVQLRKVKREKKIILERKECKRGHKKTEAPQGLKKEKMIYQVACDADKYF